MKQLRFLLAFLLIFSLILSGCSDTTTEEITGEAKVKPLSTPLDEFPNAVFYEIFPLAFYDTNGDGKGDINGITAKLDYLVDLGIDGIWLMPITDSPSYHKYDVTNYEMLDPEYGTLDDFKNLVAEAKKRDIKIIIDFVNNHTSNLHPWFRDASTNKNSPYRDWYIWADEKTNLNEKGAWGQQVWHSNGSEYFYGEFWSGMPDLNYENPEVRAEIIRLGKFWLNEVGVDGFRLDAALHIYPKKEIDKNIAWWQEFGEEMRQAKPDVFLLGEIWDRNSVIAPFLENGLTSVFNFDLSTAIVTAAQRESSTGIVAPLITSRKLYSTYNVDFIDSTFITNHDMDRVMSKVGGNVNRARMAASLLLTLPGTPFIYYGEEIGMMGVKPDEYIREPFLWGDSDENGTESKWITSRYNQNTDSVAVQTGNSISLLEHYREMIQIRRTSPVLTLGEIEDTNLSVEGVIRFIRSYENESLYVLHNMTKDEKTITLTDNEATYQFVYFSNAIPKVKLKKVDGSITFTLPAYSTVILSQ